ncbi:hypothetical protein SARC_16585 [Sphaeroforma arctica JP610]|uniref:ZP domain-containing protein n=1 Tax=Sphaeroforma arctica JP610 TaxID=667725 RepID=A0A0L0F2G7_9EUKA|nr:hypothetical protein SARC_16585 [Sphaeroforma arctica JP610]KNC70882.1 hypothetical protein SARC_16585 [Sphaeroforma arctica JP610]|eukprot:XP_014144784.1 hypothetical protein SARC_16585 [Sphaeroforma arctica JP610]
MSIQKVTLLALYATSVWAATWKDINMTVYTGEGCLEDTASSSWTIPTSPSCTQLIPGNFQFYAQYVFDPVGGTTGSIHYYNDYYCAEENRIYKFDQVYLQAFDVSGDAAICKNCLVADCSIRYAEKPLPEDVSIFSKVAITDFPAARCPSNVVATSSVVPTDGSCVPYTGGRSAMFVRHSSAVTTGDIFVFVEGTCTHLEETISSNLKNVNVALDATTECRNMDSGRQSLGITPFN